jgi:hypothetical protein
LTQNSIAPDQLLIAINILIPATGKCLIFATLMKTSVRNITYIQPVLQQAGSISAFTSVTTTITTTR